jgi:hypothetical protein
VKVDDQSKRNVQQLRVAQELGLVDGQNFLHHLSSSKRHASTKTSKRNGSSNTRPLKASPARTFDSHQALIDGGYLAQLEFAHQTSLVNAFDQAWPLESVNFNSRADSHAAQFISFACKAGACRLPTPSKRRKRRILSCAPMDM